jgi:hypothetical protein
MKYWVRITLALAFVGLIAMTAVAFGQSSTPSGSESPSPKADRRAGRDADGPGAKRLHRFKEGGFGKFGRNFVTGEFKVKTADGFATVRLDQGVVTSVGSNSLTFKRSDNETVTVPVTADTKIGKDGKRPAQLSDIKAGDIVRVMRVNSGDGFDTRSIRAHTPKPESDDTSAENRKTAFSL